MAAGSHCYAAGGVGLIAAAAAAAAVLARPRQPLRRQVGGPAAGAARRAAADGSKAAAKPCDAEATREPLLRVAGAVTAGKAGAPGTCQFLASAAALGHHVTLLELGVSGAVAQTSARLFLARQWLRSLPPDVPVMFTDISDAVLTQGPAAALAAWRRARTRGVLLSAEAEPWIPEHLQPAQKRHIRSLFEADPGSVARAANHSEVLFPNTGAWLGGAGDLAAALNASFAHLFARPRPFFDQAEVTGGWEQRGLGALISLDTRSEVFQTVFALNAKSLTAPGPFVRVPDCPPASARRVGLNEYYCCADPRARLRWPLRNNLSGTAPAYLHFNGPAKRIMESVLGGVRWPPPRWGPAAAVHFYNGTHTRCKALSDVCRRGRGFRGTCVVPPAPRPGRVRVRRR